jgi:hypothetical protein
MSKKNWFICCFVAGLLLFVSPLHAQRVSNFIISPTQVVGDTGATGTVELDAPAPVGGFLVNLFSINSAIAELPPNVVVPEGRQTATFPITTHSVTVVTATNLWAYINYDPKTAVIRPIFVVPQGYTGTTMTLAVEPSSIISGDTGHGTVYLNKPAPATGARIKLKSYNTRVKVPASVLVPAGAISIPFDITTKGYCDDDFAPLEATYKTYIATDYLYLSTVNLPQPSILSAIPDSNSVVLKWNRDPHAHKYIIRITMDGETATRDEVVTCDLTAVVVRFDDVDAVRGETTEYEIIAVNAYGPSLPSPKVAVTPALRVPLPPDRIVAVSGDKGASLVWNEVTEATTYKIYRRLSGRLAWTLLSEEYPNRFQDRFATNGLSYEYAISSVNKTREGKKSVPVTVVPSAPTQTIEAIKARARTFLIDVNQPPPTGTDVETGLVIEETPISFYPASPVLVPEKVHHANRWRVNYSHAQLEVDDATGAIVYFRRVSNGSDSSVSGASLDELTAKNRANQIQGFAGLNSVYTDWSIKSIQLFTDEPAFWDLLRRPKIGDIIVRDQHTSMNISLDGMLLSLLVYEPYPTSNISISSTFISEDDAKIAAQTILDARGITGVVYNSGIKTVVLSNDTYADPALPASPNAIRAVWDLLFVRPATSDPSIGEDAFEIWIDAETGVLRGGEQLYSASSRPALKANPLIKRKPALSTTPKATEKAQKPVQKQKVTNKKQKSRINTVKKQAKPLSRK